MIVVWRRGLAAPTRKSHAAQDLSREFAQEYTGVDITFDGFLCQVILISEVKRALFHHLLVTNTTAGIAFVSIFSLVCRAEADDEIIFVLEDVPPV